MFVGIARSVLLVFGIVSIGAGRYVNVPAVFLLEFMLFLTRMFTVLYARIYTFYMHVNY
jgi:hypothetical protein